MPSRAYVITMSGHDHHDHDHSDLSETELRVRALETIPTEKGYIDPAALDLLIETYEKKVGPRNGARVVARAWADPGYLARLREDPRAALAEELGVSLPDRLQVMLVEERPDLLCLVIPVDISAIGDQAAAAMTGLPAPPPA